MSSELKAWGRKNATQLKAVFEKHRKKRSKGLEEMKALLPEELSGDFEKWKSQIKSTKKYVSSFTKLVSEDDERGTLSETDQCATREASESHQEALESRPETLESHQETLESHQETLESHQATLESHQETQQSERATPVESEPKIPGPPKKLEITLEKLLSGFKEEDDFDVLRRITRAWE